MKWGLNIVMNLSAALRKLINPSFISFILLGLWCSVLQAQDGIIKGKVKDNEVFLEKATASLASQVHLTNSFGEFSFIVKPGTYTLIVTHVGYKKNERVIIIKAGESRSFDINMMREEQMEEVVVLGSRSQQQRSSLKTAVPVDIITSTELKQTAQQSVMQMLNFTSPSLNTSRQNLLEPITLRGLSPDHSLILLNGTRYHNSPYINNASIRGMLGRGAVSNDLASIPISAIEKIEILRDGATAQYGSDAIGGVINILLKESTGKTSINLHTGQYYKGDGESIVFGINYGIRLNKKKSSADKQGFLNFSADFRFREATHRGGIYTGTVYTTNKMRDDSIIQAKGFNRKTPVSNDGIIPLNSSGFLINGGLPINSKIEFFWTGTATYRHIAWPGMYRFPKNTDIVNTLLYPDGFKSVAILNSWDISGTAGARGKTKNNWNWEWNSAYGRNTNYQKAENSNNASQIVTLGANAPKNFYGGRPSFAQQSNTFSLAKDLSKKINRFKTFNLGFGIEHRFEKLRTRQGEEASWQNYDTSGRTQGGVPGSGSIGPDGVINENRHVGSLYVDMETDVNSKFLVNLASRYEYYSDFGGNLAGKLAMRYIFSPAFALRGSISNGYHAPALQQIYYTARGNVFKYVNGILIQVQRGAFPNNHDVTKAFGVKPLQPEKAINLGAGFTSTFSSHIGMTIDAYWIQIKKRIILSGAFDKANNPDVARILINHPEIDQVQFISNAINTRNRGIDIVLNSNWKIRRAVFRFMLSANFNRTNLFGAIESADSLSANSQNTNTLFNREERIKIEKSQPSSKMSLSANYTFKKIGFLIRSTRFGKTAYAFGIDDRSRDEFFSTKILTDISINYMLTSWFNIAAGANNVFNVYPDKLKNVNNTNQGILIYSNESSPFGFNGGYYYVQMNFNF